MAVLAVVFDFDETLLPDSTTAFLESRGIDAARFWRDDVGARIREGYDPTLAYLNELLANAEAKRPLAGLSNGDLREFGATLEGSFYPGIPGLFDDLRAIVAKYRDLTIEFFIVSGGLKAVIDGSPTVQRHFAATYGCEFAEDAQGAIRFIKRAVTFTEKTRFLFEIHKGVTPADTLKTPYLVNVQVQPKDRRVPFENMFYIGDGLTDIPCFSLLKANHGAGFGVFDPKRDASAKRAYLDFLRTGRVININTPRYGTDHDLGLVLRTAVEAQAANLSVRRAEAE